MAAAANVHVPHAKGKGKYWATKKQAVWPGKKAIQDIAHYGAMPGDIEAALVDEARTYELASNMVLWDDVPADQRSLPGVYANYYEAARLVRLALSSPEFSTRLTLRVQWRNRAEELRAYLVDFEKTLEDMVRDGELEGSQ